MRKIHPRERKVANIYSDDSRPLKNSDGSDSGIGIFQHDVSKPLGVGFHVYKMGPGTKFEAHEHIGNEEFLILDGELIDNDGTVYRRGDLVWLKARTQHYSWTRDGCVIAAYVPKLDPIIEPD